MNEFFLKNLKMPGREVLLTSLPFKTVTETIRAYYKAFEDGCDFYIVEWTGNDRGAGEYFDGLKVTVQCLCHGVIYWDGLRHLYFGDDQTDNYGYLYYIRPSEIVACMVVIRELEKDHCPEHGLPETY